jgi:hypothetical protein
LPIADRRAHASRRSRCASSPCGPEATRRHAVMSTNNKMILPALGRSKSPFGSVSSALVHPPKRGRIIGLSDTARSAQEVYPFNARFLQVFRATVCVTLQPCDQTCHPVAIWLILPSMETEIDDKMPSNSCSTLIPATGRQRRCENVIQKEVSCFRSIWTN